jgi:hypothetical protein
VQHKKKGARRGRAIRPLIVTPQQCLTSPSAPPTTPQPLPGHPPWHRLKGSGGTVQQSQALDPSPSKRFNKGFKTTPTSMWGSSGTSSEGSGVAPHNAPSSPKSKGDPCPHDPCRTSFGQTKTSTWSSYGSSSTAWALLWRDEATSTTCNTSSWKNAKWQLQRGYPQSCSDRLPTH